MVNPIRIQCDFYGKSILGLPTWVQVMRSGSVLSLIASALAAFMGLLATGTTVVYSLEGKKQKM